MFNHIKQKIKQYRVNRLEQAALDKYGCDLKCPHCGIWMHTNENSKAESMDKTLPNSYGVYIYTCGGCSGSSTWNFSLAPVPIMTTYNPIREI